MIGSRWYIFDRYIKCDIFIYLPHGELPIGPLHGRGEDIARVGAELGGELLRDLLLLLDFLGDLQLERLERESKINSSSTCLESILYAKRERVK